MSFRFIHAAAASFARLLMLNLTSVTTCVKLQIFEKLWKKRDAVDARLMLPCSVLAGWNGVPSVSAFHRKRPSSEQDLTESSLKLRRQRHQLQESSSADSISTNQVPAKALAGASVKSSLPGKRR
ncbi:hypothetical protein GE061_003148 [Apolygus lucorum]|uniref:Secreted protein n=1 Tax=Apolygus lucorum TaxID=248454 RepID=A0A8S9X3S6_APOLU|nr:hypothetical protein GE061_003148 [Apolygus lucorum]